MLWLCLEGKGDWLGAERLSWHDRVEARGQKDGGRLRYLLLTERLTRHDGAEPRGLNRGSRLRCLLTDIEVGYRERLLTVLDQVWGWRLLD